MPQNFVCHSLPQTSGAGRSIASALRFPSCVYLRGDMAAGKTTLAKAIIAGLGYCGDVTSPTYNIIQEYPVQQGTVYHMDLYRLEDPNELEFLALDDLWCPKSLFLIEWPERGGGHIRPADFEINIAKVSGAQTGVRRVTLS